MTTQTTADSTNGSATSTVQLSLSSLIESPHNPRKTFETKELAASIKQHGVIQAILVRPWTGEKYQIVCGARRFRAAKEAGLTTIKAEVRELTDKQAMEIQIVENLQRDDVDPLDEASGYENLMRVGKYTVEQVAEKVGKSRSYVYQRVKLLTMRKDAKKLMEKGEITTSHAVLLATLPEHMQKKAVDQWDGNYGDWQSVRELRQWIADNVFVDLTKAPFPLDKADLVLKAGACSHCSKNTDVKQGITDPHRKSTCIDPVCFGDKVEKWIKHQHAMLTKTNTGRLGAVLISTSVYEPKGDVLGWDDYERSTKSDKQARPGIIVDGGEKGTVIWIREKKKRAATSKAKKKSPHQLREEQKAKEREAVCTEIFRRSDKIPATALSPDELRIITQEIIRVADDLDNPQRAAFTKALGVKDVWNADKEINKLSGQKLYRFLRIGVVALDVGKSPFDKTARQRVDRLAKRMRIDGKKLLASAAHKEDKP